MNGIESICRLDHILTRYKNSALNIAPVCRRRGTRDRVHFPLRIPTKTNEGGDNREFREELTQNDVKVALMKVVEDPTIKCLCLLMVHKIGSACSD